MNARGASIHIQTSRQGETVMKVTKGKLDTNPNTTQNPTPPKPGPKPRPKPGRASAR